MARHCWVPSHRRAEARGLNPACDLWHHAKHQEPPLPWIRKALFILIGGRRPPPLNGRIPCVVPVADLRLMAMYVTSVLAGKNRKLQGRIGHRNIRHRTG